MKIKSETRRHILSLDPNNFDEDIRIKDNILRLLSYLKPNREYDIQEFRSVLNCGLEELCKAVIYIQSCNILTPKLRIYSTCGSVIKEFNNLNDVPNTILDQHTNQVIEVDMNNLHVIYIAKSEYSIINWWYSIFG